MVNSLKKASFSDLREEGDIAEVIKILVSDKDMRRKKI